MHVAADDETDIDPSFLEWLVSFPVDFSKADARRVSIVKPWLISHPRSIFWFCDDSHRFLIWVIRSGFEV